MSGPALVWTARLGLFVRRFVLEVLASAVVTACAAAATTIYLHDVKPTLRRPALDAEVGDLLSPVASPGAGPFVAVKPEGPSQAARGEYPVAVLPPRRPRIVAARLQPAAAQPVPARSKAPAPDQIPVPITADVAMDDRPEPETGMVLPDEPPSPPAAQTDRQFLGMALPDLIPEGSGVLRGFRGLGNAVWNKVP